MVAYSLMGRRLCAVRPPFDETSAAGTAANQQVSCLTHSKEGTKSMPSFLERKCNPIYIFAKTANCYPQFALTSRGNDVTSPHVYSRNLTNRTNYHLIA